LSAIRRFFETLRYVPGYYRIFFLYMGIILMVFLYVIFFRRNPMLFAATAGIALYAGIGVPIVLQNIISRVSRSLGWWIAILFVLLGFFGLLSFLVASDLLDTNIYNRRQLSFSGIIYWANVIGIIWTAALAGAGVVNMMVHHGFGGLRSNLSWDIRERYTIRRLTRGEPLILDKRTVIMVILAIVFTGSIFVLRGFLVQRPDLVTTYSVPRNLSVENPGMLTLMLENMGGKPITSIEVQFTGYYRYPATLNVTGETGGDMLELAKKVDVIERAFSMAEDAPADMVIVIPHWDFAGNIKEIYLDFHDAFEHVELYENETSYQKIPSRFIVQWDRQEKRLESVWVGTPGIPFARIVNMTRLDGRGNLTSTTPYSDMVSSGKIEMRDIQPEDPYGFNLTLVYHQWLGPRYDVVDLFFLGAEMVLEEDKPRKLVNLEIRRIP
jgi:succinate dehydrogenase/fumarate reductase cytochrome b subunit